MQYNKATLGILILVAGFMLVSCRGGGGSVGDPASEGKEIFEQATIGSAARCKTCHSLEPGAIIIGPSIAGIGTQAVSRIPGMSAEEYLRESIIDPNAYVVENFPASVMPNVYASQLTEEQVDLLVAYMLSLE